MLPGKPTDAFISRKYTPLAPRNGMSSASIEVDFAAADASWPWPEAAMDAVRFAAYIWESHVSSPVTLYIKAYWDDIGSPLASGGPTTSVSNFPGAMADTRYPVALYRSMTGSSLPPPEIIPSQADMIMYINRTKNWSYRTDGTPVANRYDLVSVAMHEVGHGLGFIGSESYSEGVGGLGDPPHIYDRFVEDAVGTALLDETTYPNPSTDLGGAFTSGVLIFDGANVASHAGSTAALFAPSTWDRGSSYSHLDYNTYPPGNINSLMNPFSSTAEVQHAPGPVTCGMLADMGWSLGADCYDALPVELAAFDATVSGPLVLLRWTTLSEADNAGFDVEHRAASGRFNRIGFVNGMGTTGERSNYEFAIPGLALGTHTFRLRQIDLDGGFQYSPEVEIALEVSGDVFVEGPYPNPFGANTVMAVSVKRSQQVDVQLFDVLGRSVSHVFSGVMASDQPSRLHVDGSRLAAGTYVYLIRGEDFRETGVLQRL